MNNVDPKCRVYKIELESSGAFRRLLQCVGSERRIVIGVIKWVSEYLELHRKCVKTVSKLSSDINCVEEP